MQRPCLEELVVEGGFGEEQVGSQSLLLVECSAEEMGAVEGVENIEVPALGMGAIGWAHSLGKHRPVESLCGSERRRRGGKRRKEEDVGGSGGSSRMRSVAL